MLYTICVLSFPLFPLSPKVFDQIYSVIYHQPNAQSPVSSSHYCCLLFRPFLMFLNTHCSDLQSLQITRYLTKECPLYLVSPEGNQLYWKNNTRNSKTGLEVWNKAISTNTPDAHLFLLLFHIDSLQKHTKVCSSPKSASVYILIPFYRILTVLCRY